MTQTQSLISPKDSLVETDINGRLQIQKALSELQAFRNEVFPNDSKELWIIEFENLGISPADAASRIRNARYTESYGKTKFSQFVDPDIEDLIPNDLVYKKAIQLLERNDKKLEEFCIRTKGKAFKYLTKEQSVRLDEILREDELYTDHIKLLKDKVAEAEELGKELKRLNEQNEILKAKLLEQ